MLKPIKNFLVNRRFRKLLQDSMLLKSQIQDPSTIPIIIINFNQLFYLKQLIDFLISRKFSNIIIVDNKSTYPPLLEYYEQVRSKVILELMDNNYGHMVFFNTPKLLKKYGNGFFVLTDADIVPNKNLPENFMEVMKDLLIKYNYLINKVGFALGIDDIPDTYPLKDKVLNWEAQYWKKQVEDNIFDAPIDTTFALYKPNYTIKGSNFYYGYRIGGDYTAKHGGWYVDLNNPTEEYNYYRRTSTTANSWKMDDNGNLIGGHSEDYNGG